MEEEDCLEQLAQKTGSDPESDNNLSSAGDGFDLSEFNLDVNIVPNPFIIDTEVRIKISHSSKIRVEVYTLQGEKVAELFDGYIDAEELMSIECSIKNVYNTKYMLCVIHTDFGVVTKPMLIRSNYK